MPAPTPPSTTPTSTATEGSRVPPHRVFLHALWVGPVAILVLQILVQALAGLLSHDPDLSDGILPGIIVWFVLMPGWLPAAVAVSGVAGAVAAAAAERAARSGARRAARAAWGAGAAALVVGLPLTLLLGQGGWGWLLRVVPVVTAAVVGGASVWVARPPAGSTHPGRAWWVGVAVVVGGAGLALLGWLWWQGPDLFDDDPCQSLLPGENVMYARTGFPPQSWCVSPHEAVAFAPAWAGPAVVALLAMAVVCGVVALLWQAGGHWSPARRFGGPWAIAGGSVALAAGIAVTVAAGVQGAHPPAEARRDAVEAAARAAAREAAAREAPPTDQGAADVVDPPEPAPVSPAPVSLDQARADAAVLTDLAQQAGGPDLLWPAPLAVEEVPCDGGTMLFLRGRFTTRDLATATDNVDFLLITQDNEVVAQAIADAWSASGKLSAPEPLHGEWWQGPRTATSVETAHVGFDQGVGEVKVTSLCATG